VKKRKRKGICSLMGWGEVFGPARRGEGAREGAGPAAAHGRGRRRGRMGATASSRGPLVSESGGGKTALRADGAGEPAERGRKAGRRWA
jgi:hypothetical protein